MQSWNRCTNKDHVSIGVLENRGLPICEDRGGSDQSESEHVRAVGLNKELKIRKVEGQQAIWGNILLSTFFEEAITKRKEFHLGDTGNQIQPIFPGFYDLSNIGRI